AQWAHTDVTRFLDFLFEHQSEAGDSGNFKNTTFTAAALYLEETRTEGAVKNAAACKRKWFALKKIFRIINEIKSKSGWGSWHDDFGANVNTTTADVWDRYVAKNPDAKPFRNKGWIYLEQVEKVVPYKPRGTHV
ncbi:hypothetical protein BDP27DRAFT_1190788, partial [Rhodocollybia butyracea]